MIRLTVVYDGDYSESPNEWGGFEVRSFSSRHLSHIDPASIFGCDECGGWESEHDAEYCGGEWQPTEDRQRALFGLSYYEHGRCQWYLGDKVGEPGPTSCPFDSVGVAGVLMMSADTAEWVEREGRDSEVVRKSAEAFVETFTEWSNGDIYYLRGERFAECSECSHPRSAGEIEPILGSVYGTDLAFNIADMIANMEPDVGERVELIGEASGDVWIPDVQDELARIGEHLALEIVEG